MTAWLDGLNPAQREAVTAGAGPLLIVAGAGTGKTRTLACRVAYLIEQGVPPDRMLLLTFTRCFSIPTVTSYDRSRQSSSSGLFKGHRLPSLKASTW